VKALFLYLYSNSLNDFSALPHETGWVLQLSALSPTKVVASCQVLDGPTYELLKTLLVMEGPESEILDIPGQQQNRERLVN
jgi:hypothetical protein